MVRLVGIRVFQIFWGYGNRRFLGTTFAPDRRETLRTAKKLRFLLSPGHVMEILTPVELAPPWPPLEAWGQQNNNETIKTSKRALPGIRLRSQKWNEDASFSRGDINVTHLCTLQHSAITTS